MEMVLEEVCASCGNSRLPYGRFCLFCGDLLTDDEPAGTAKASSRGAAAPANFVASKPLSIEYAGFWLRVWAGAIDVALEAAGALVLTWAIDGALRRFGHLLGLSPFGSKVATGEAFILILAVGAWLYCAFTESSAWRATLGKRWLGLQVITGDGDRLSFAQASIRHLMKFLSLFCLTIGFMMSGWTRRSQALHDMPGDCLVIRVPRKGFSLLGQ